MLGCGGGRLLGRKRVDAMGPLLAVVAPSAGIQDRVAARALLVRLFLRFEISSPFCGWRAMQRHADWVDAGPIRLEWASGQAQ